MIDLDCHEIEERIAASQSGEKVEDPYRKIAAKYFNCKEADVTQEMRQRVKEQYMLFRYGGVSSLI